MGKELGRTASVFTLVRAALSERSWEFLSLPNCAVAVLVHARRHSLVVLISNMFAYHLRVQEAVTANAAMPLVAGEDVRTPLGAFRVVFGIGHLIISRGERFDAIITRSRRYRLDAPPRTVMNSRRSTRSPR